MTIDLQPSQNINEFFPWLKEESERLWESKEVSKYFRKGTKWLPGLTVSQIADYEQEMGFAFPEMYRMFLRCMNGTERFTHMVDEDGAWNADGYNTVWRREVIDSFYSYPRDMKDIKLKIKGACRLNQREFDRKGIPHIMPIISHRFLIIDRCEINPVLSIAEGDRLPYADSLNNFLLNEVFLKEDSNPIFHTSRSNSGWIPQFFQETEGLPR